MDASNSDITCTESVTHNFALIVITQTAHIPGEEAVSSSASIHWTHNPHLDTNRDVSQGRARGRGARAPAQGPYFHYKKPFNP